MDGPLGNLHLTNPVLAAPMAGGPTTPAMVLAAAGAGSLGFLAGGYKTASQLSEQIAEVRSSTEEFGVNLFAPNSVPVDADQFRKYASAIQDEADLYDIDLAEAAPLEDDDHWQDKIDLLVSGPVPIVSFTFGIPDYEVIAALRAAGTVVVQTVTSVDEARLALEAGVDMLAVQASAAGGHSGTLTPEQAPDPVPLPDLVSAVRTEVDLPVIGAGGIGSPRDVSEVLQAGAQAVAVGTLLLRTEESGASATHKAALAAGAGRDTLVTRAFTGRPARSLRNLFADRYDTIAPLGYPALHHLTSPVRRAAAAAGDPERINLWAGTGYRHAGEGSTADVLTRLAEHA